MVPNFLASISTLLQNVSLGEALTWAGSVGGAILAWYKGNPWIVAPLKALWAKFLASCPSRANGEKLDYILGQLKPNGGGSLKDALNRLESNLADLSTELSFLKIRSQSRDDRAEIASFKTNELGECVDASKSYCALVGLTEEEVLGNGWANAIAAKDRELVSSEWRAAVQEKRDFHLTFCYRHPKNGEFPVKVDAFLVKNKTGKVLGYLGFSEPAK